MFRKEMLVNRLQLIFRPVYAGLLDVLFVQDVKQKGQTHDVVEVDVRNKDVQRRRFQMIAHAKHSRSGVQHDSDFRQHQADGVPAVVRVVAGRS